MTRAYTTDSNWKLDRDGNTDRDSNPSLRRREEKILRPDALFVRVDPMQAKFLRREFY